VDKMLIIGQHGQISFSVFDETPAELTTAEKSITQAMLKPTPIQGDFVQAMADHLARNSEHPSMAQSGAHTNWVMNEILSQAE
jgi:1,5-anhydro-D-fructose reductase (1,5-anhydro-D-mannitol-forming)